MTQCSATFEDAVVDTFVMGIRLVGYEASQIEKRAADVLANPEVNAAIAKALNKQMLALAREQLQGKTTGGADVLAKAMMDDVAPKAGKQYLKEVQKSDAYNAAKKGLVDLGCAWKQTPIGAWVDENKMMLIIVAGGLALGGGIALYRARAGDVPADWATRIAMKALKFKILGDVEVGVDKLKFKPSDRAVELQAFTEFTAWKSVKSRFAASVSTKDDAVIEFGGEMELSAANMIGPVTGVLKANIGANRPPSELPQLNDLKVNYRLALGIKAPKDKLAQGLEVEIMAFVEEKNSSQKIGATSKLSYDRNVAGQPLSVYATGSASHTSTPGKADKGEYAFEAGFSWKF